MATESTPRSRQRRHLLIAGAAVAAAARVPAQDPGPPIRLIVPYAAGGPIDVTARVLAERVRDTLGTVLIDNKGGAGGNIGADAIARAAPDGLTIGIAATATHAVNPWLYARLPYDAAKDFAGITQLVRVPNVLVMNVARAEQFGIHRLADLVAYAKAHPARLNYGSGGNGSAGHLAGEMFKQRAGIFALHIPYRGASPAQLALLAGEVDFNIDNLAAAAPNIRAGKLKALAVTSLEASPALPGVPPLAATYAGFAIDTWWGLVAPAATPRPVIDRLHQAFVAALDAPQTRARFAALLAEPVASTPRQFDSFMASERAKYRQLVQDSGAKVD
ncbi:tripartite tricarboxylate transporter substrate binding protein [Verminephrobacter eiseniae]|uniref:tripartite tricarboxylate transporter substrate binding protein n=1 Tax=Verminephrobacter eiseniae TaxID=364317 RepID=UPI002237894D|nr:tripartite tricarboxylate transporter substrate binding protein [Verminephrobacter eiseniae]MCW5234525.1 tripartite tricarboxylate transporter substrate binding protein [Verminephrobacter eiseniae]MCW5262713.1 tripartite tricarboxylate transporter substrate binding protein [Verminephrobacter eiseniae]